MPCYNHNKKCPSWAHKWKISSANISKIGESSTSGCVYAFTTSLLDIISCSWSFASDPVVMHAFVNNIRNIFLKYERERERIVMLFFHLGSKWSFSLMQFKFVAGHVVDYF